MRLTSAHLLAFLALLVAIGGGLATAHNGNPAKIHFCIAGNGGNVRAVAPDKACSEGETAQDIRTQQVAFLHADRGPTRYPAGKASRRVSAQLIIPADGTQYVVSGKLVVRKPAGARQGAVTCALDGTGEGDIDDTARVTLGPGESDTLSLLGRANTIGRPGEILAAVINCSSPASAYTVSFLKIAAQPMDTVSQGIDVPSAQQPDGTG
jgi:hypothetical protein